MSVALTLTLAVILGSYRCSMAGVDLNRQWLRPHQAITPTVFFMKKLLTSVADRCDIYADLHGHSRKKDCFFYGCPTAEGVAEKILPFMLSEECQSFALEKTTFSMSKSKAGTGRVVRQTECGIKGCWTLEASFAGSSGVGGSGVKFGHGLGIHYHARDLEGIGAGLGRAFARWAREIDPLTGLPSDPEVSALLTYFDARPSA